MPTCPFHPTVMAEPCPVPALRSPGAWQQPPLESRLHGNEVRIWPKARLHSRCLLSLLQPAWLAPSTSPSSISPCLSVSEIEPNWHSPLRTLSKCICKMHRNTLLKMSAECQGRCRCHTAQNWERLRWQQCPAHVPRATQPQQADPSLPPASAWQPVPAGCLATRVLWDPTGQTGRARQLMSSPRQASAHDRRESMDEWPGLPLIFCSLPEPLRWLEPRAPVAQSDNQLNSSPCPSFLPCPLPPGASSHPGLSTHFWGNPDWYRPDSAKCLRRANCAE